MLRHLTLDVFLGPAADVGALVGGQVVQDHVDRGAVGPGGTIDFRAANVVAAPFLRRSTPHRVSVAD
ncbi:hypothetical protein GCM10011574_46810 [Microbispora bryophytorum]|uniref:Uncharacterized protein n=1 Tax=Microbispora bryophytorum TaxID=1460882 RepID=A0A8H9H2P4_9ACTN|nr:hypothetical protein GCM10011574_46810 [Microbispora bryophytorum]